MRTLLFVVPTAAGTFGGLLLSCYLVRVWGIPEVDVPGVRTVVVLLGCFLGVTVGTALDFWYRWRRHAPGRSWYG